MLEGLDEASIEDLEILADYHKKGIVYLIHEQEFNSHKYKPGLNKILNHESGNTNIHIYIYTYIHIYIQ